MSDNKPFVDETPIIDQRYAYRPSTKSHIYLSNIHFKEVLIKVEAFGLGLMKLDLDIITASKEYVFMMIKCRLCFLLVSLIV